MNDLHTRIFATFNQDKSSLGIDPTSYVHSQAIIVGNVYLGKKVLITTGASLLGEADSPIWVGDGANIQDGVVLNASQTCWGTDSAQMRDTEVELAEEFRGIYIGDRVSLANDSQVNGSVRIGSDTFIGMQVQIFHATIGTNCVVEPNAVVKRVNIPNRRYVPAGVMLTNQQAADNLPLIDEKYPLRDFNQAVVNARIELASLRQLKIKN